MVTRAKAVEQDTLNRMRAFLFRISFRRCFSTGAISSSNSSPPSGCSSNTLFIACSGSAAPFASVSTEFIFPFWSVVNYPSMFQTCSLIARNSVTVRKHAQHCQDTSLELSHATPKISCKDAKKYSKCSPLLECEICFVIYRDLKLFSREIDIHTVGTSSRLTQLLFIKEVICVSLQGKGWCSHFSCGSKWNSGSGSRSLTSHRPLVFFFLIGEVVI